ncbi:MAG: C40 family peptidase [Lachnospiraceae bacterium]|nr:C40 family peptidase [Lachnospiraceae bacterium]
MLPKGISKESYFFTAQDTVPYYENEAYAFRRITTQEVVIEAEAALSKSDTGIREESSDDARIVGSLKEGDLVYVIEEADDGWLFVESGDVRGFILSDELDRSNSVQAQIDEEGESSFGTAKEVIAPKENQAVYYSLSSVKEGAKYNEVREKILEKALSCVGNPYVWGGTSLTHGADCSGFVQTLYGLFGYKLPRVAAAQSRVGTQIPVSDAAPGDLIFFARNGYVYHVAMYAGDGKTVEAYSSQYGIITTELSERNAVWATRIIED